MCTYIWIQITILTSSKLNFERTRWLYINTTHSLTRRLLVKRITTSIKALVIWALSECNIWKDSFEELSLYLFEKYSIFSWLTIFSFATDNLGGIFAISWILKPIQENFFFYNVCRRRPDNQLRLRHLRDFFPFFFQKDSLCERIY